MAPAMDESNTLPGKDAGLSTRELDVLRLLALGLSNREIAGQLALSANTIRLHLTSIFHKLDVGSRTEAVATAIRRGIIRMT